MVRERESKTTFSNYLEQNLVKIELPEARPEVEISIVFPAYNEEEGIERTLESLARQTVKNFEVIVVDNNSTDRTAEIVRRFIELHPGLPVYYLKETAKGPGRARKRGMDQVVARSGNGNKIKYMICTDADIVMPPDWVEQIHRMASAEESDVVCGEVSYFDGIDNSELHFIDRAKRFLSREFITQYLGCNLAISTKAYTRIGGITQPYNDDGSIAAGEDVRMVQAVIREGGKITLGKSCVQMDPRRYLVNLVAGEEATATVYGRVFDDVRGSEALNKALEQVPPRYFTLFKNRIMRSQFKRHIVGVYLDPTLRERLWQKAKGLMEPRGEELEAELIGKNGESVDINHLWQKYGETFLTNLDFASRGVDQERSGQDLDI